MAQKEVKKISAPALRRLPLYFYFLSDLLKKGRHSVSSTEIAEFFHFDKIKVRKDLAATGVTGRPKTGFDISQLIEKISVLLGWGDLDEAVLAGCGDLGSALLGYQGFADYGIDILAAFDNDEKKIGKKIKGKLVFPLSRMKGLCQRMSVKIGIITVPAKSAQAVADLMVKGGVKGILNFSPCALKVPEDVSVQQYSMATSISILVNKVKNS